MAFLIYIQAAFFSSSVYFCLRGFISTDIHFFYYFCAKYKFECL
jgi:hypothetical protein